MILRVLGMVSLLALAASCGSPAPIRIGFLAGLSGPASELGVGARRSLEMGVDEINRAGGIRGRPLELVTVDDGNDPQQGLAAFQHLSREKVVAVIGPVASTVLSTVLPYLNEEKLLTVSPTASAASASGSDDWFFRVITVNRQMGEVLGTYAVEHGLSDVAVVRETSNDAYTRPIFQAFRDTMASSGATVRTPIEFDLRSGPDYDALAQRLGSAAGYLVLANGYDTAQIGQKLAIRGQLGPLLAPPWAMTSEVIALGGRQVERVTFVSIYDSESRNPRWLTFRDAYRDLYGDEPGFAAVYARDALTLLVQALREARTLNPDDLRAAVKAISSVAGLQSDFRLDAYGDVIRDLFILTVEDGHFVRIHR